MLILPSLLLLLLLCVSFLHCLENCSVEYSALHIYMHCPTITTKLKKKSIYTKSGMVSTVFQSLNNFKVMINVNGMQASNSSTLLVVNVQSGTTCNMECIT